MRAVSVDDGAPLHRARRGIEIDAVEQAIERSVVELDIAFPVEGLWNAEGALVEALIDPYFSRRMARRRIIFHRLMEGADSRQTRVSPFYGTNSVRREIGPIGPEPRDPRRLPRASARGQPPGVVVSAASLVLYYGETRVSRRESLGRARCHQRSAPAEERRSPPMPRTDMSPAGMAFLVLRCAGKKRPTSARETTPASAAPPTT